MIELESGERIIDYSLALCKIYDLEPLAIVREEKADLVSYLQERRVETFPIVVEGEWQQSVLRSWESWAPDNILILPDTRFGETKALSEIKASLELGCRAVLAIHEVQDPERWGVISDYRLVDKPQELTFPQQAWGLIGFKRDYGAELFTSIQGDLEWAPRLKDTGFVYLDWFKDITRKA